MELNRKFEISASYRSISLCR